MSESPISIRRTSIQIQTHLKITFFNKQNLLKIVPPTVAGSLLRALRDTATLRISA